MRDTPVSRARRSIGLVTGPATIEHPTMNSAYSSRYHGYARSTQERPRTLNVRLLIGSLLTIAVFGTSLFFWHRYQVRQLAVALLERADRLEAEEAWSDAANALYRYWRIQPDPEVLARLAQDYDKALPGNQKRPVINSYYRAIGFSPDRLDLRVRLAELLVSQHQYTTAKEHAEYVLATEPDNLPALKWRSLALHGEYQTGRSVGIDESLEAVKAAFERMPADVRLAETLVHIYRVDMQGVNGTPSAAASDEAMDRLVAANPENAMAYLARFRYAQRYGVGQPADDLRRALELAPDNPAIVAVAAESARNAANWPVARQLFTKLTSLAPSHALGYLGLGDAEYTLGRRHEALAAWQQGLKAQPRDMSVMFRIAEALTDLRQFDEAKKAFEAIDRAIGTLATSGSENDRKWASAGVALLRAKWHLVQGQPLAAIPLLKLAAASGTHIPHSQSQSIPAALQAHALLGRAYSELNQWEQAAASYEQVLTIRNDMVETQLAAAHAWGKVGQLDKAILRCEQATQAPNVPAAAWLLLAQYRLEAELRLPDSERRWERFEAALSQARQQLPDSWELQLLEADHLMLRFGEAKQGQALALLWTLEQSQPNDAALHSQLALAYAAFGRPDESERALENYSNLRPTSITPRLLRADLLLLRGDCDAAQRVLDAAGRIAKEPAEIQAVDFARSRLAMCRDSQPLAVAEFERLAAAYPERPQLVERLVELALANDPNQATKWIRRLKEIEGDDGATWRYFEARQQLANATSIDDPQFGKVLVQLQEIQALRPNWAGYFELSGRVAGFRRETSEAIGAYSTAMRLGADDAEVQGRLLGQLYDNSQVITAVAHVRQWNQRRPLSRSLADGSGGMVMRQARRDSLLKSARQAAAQHPEDVEAQMWLGNVLLVQNDLQTAGEVFRRIVEFSPRDARAQMALLSSQVLVGEVEEAIATASQMADQEGLFQSPAVRYFALGQAYEMIGDRKQAEQYYRQVGNHTRYSVAAKSRVEALADIASRAVLASSPAQADNRPDASGSHAPTTTRSPVVDQRLEAVVRLRRGGRNDVLRATQLLEQIIDNGSVEDEDRLLLASIYEQRGDVEAAREQLRLVVAGSPTAWQIAEYVDFLLRHDEEFEAETWLKRLEKQAPMTHSAVALRSRWLAGTERHEEIVPLVEQYATSRLQHISQPESIKQHLLEVAEIYQSAGLPQSAERWLSQLASQFPDQAEPLARHLASHDATQRAIELCLEGQHGPASPETATLLARVLVFGEPSAEMAMQAAPIIDGAIQQFPENASLLFAAGNLRLKQNRIDEAIQLLTRVTRVNAGHILAWNNLAALLAEQDGREDEALKLIDRALEVAGYNMPTLLDTKAIVLMHMGRLTEAVELLEQVTASSITNDPRFFFHLSLALGRLSRHDQAREALSEAQSLGLDGAFLTHKEKSMLTDLGRNLTL